MAETVPTDVGFVLVNGKVLTVDRAFSVAEAIAVRGDRIAAVGSNAEARAAGGPDARVVDLGGRTVVPGLIDAHAHLDLMWRQVPSLEDCRSIAEVQERIAARAREAEPGQWLIFRALADPEVMAPKNLAEGRFPTRDELDRPAPRNPVWIQGSYITPSAVNSLALRLGGISRDTPQPKRLEPIIAGRSGNTVLSTGGQIEKDPTTGEPTGLLHDYNTLLARPATAPLWKLMPTPSYDDRIRNLEQGQREFHAVGITAVHESHGSEVLPIETSYRAYLDLWSRGKLTVRTNMVTNVPTGGSEADILARLDALAYTAHAGAGDDFLRFGGIGLNLDGAGGGGCAVQPKADSWDGPRDAIRDGVQYVPGDQFGFVCREAARRGMRLSCKAGGEAIVELLLDGYAEAEREYGIRERWVMFHSLFVRPDQLDRLRELKVVPVSCATFIWNHGAQFVRYYGPELANRAIPIRSYLQAGLPYANGTDSYPKSPFYSLWLMITRTDGETGQPLGEAERVSREDALRIYTNNGAHLLEMDDRLGSLEAGKYADFVVISGDYLTMPEADIRDLSALLTMVGGRIVHTRPELSV